MKLRKNLRVMNPVVILVVFALTVSSASSFIQSSTTTRPAWGVSEKQYNKDDNPLTLHIFDKMFEEEGPLGKGITVGKVQVALTANDRGPDSIFGLLDRASMSSDDSSEGLAEMCHELCIALMRKQDDWIAASSDSRWFSGNDAGKAESQYNEWSIRESTKFEKEYLAKSSSQAGGSTVVVVSIILEIEGDNTVFDKAGFSRSETQKVLTSIASDVLVDDGQVVNAFEAFWTPGDGNEVLTTRDIIADFPELVTL